MQLLQYRVVIALGVIATLAGCSKKSDTATTDSTKTVTSTQQILITPANDNDSTRYPDAKLTIVSPREGQVLKEAKDSVGVIMMVSGITLGTATQGDNAKGIAYSTQGQHVHVIVDNKPYMADYRNGQPFMVGVLAPGVHTIRAFPSYSWHESIKAPGAFATRTFYVGEGPKGSPSTPTTNLLGPLLTYSRPKGTYTVQEAQKLLLDFYVTNATLGSDAYQIQLWIDGKQQPNIVKWQPYYISGLGAGKHTIKMQLIDAKGQPVPGDYNAPTADITIQ